MATAALTERYAANLHGLLSCFDSRRNKGIGYAPVRPLLAPTASRQGIVRGPAEQMDGLEATLSNGGLADSGI